tara:strand:- start:538 stop:894 length:357 start_codon:yes stop_codon:yes gene_type:complete
MSEEHKIIVPTKTIAVISQFNSSHNSNMQFAEFDLRPQKRLNKLVGGIEIFIGGYFGIGAGLAGMYLPFSEYAPISSLDSRLLFKGGFVATSIGTWMIIDGRRRWLGRRKKGSFKWGK